MRTQNGDIKTKGIEKKHSGAPDTLLENTLLNICINFYVLNISDLSVVMHEGDDFIIAARAVSINTPHAKELVHHINLKQKFSTVSVARFCGKFLSPNCYGPDVVYCTAKVLSKWFKHEADFWEYQIAVGDWLSSIRDWNSYHELAEMTSVYYQRKISKLEAENLFSFLAGFSSISFDDYRKHLDFSIQYITYTDAKHEITPSTACTPNWSAPSHSLISLLRQ